MNRRLTELIPGVSIKRVGAAEQVVEVLRSEILAGHLRPGTPLSEVTLSISLGVSRHTLREAFRVLVHEGLLRHSVHRGVTVTAPTEDDVADIFGTRRLLELAAAEVASHAPADQRSLLEDSLHDLEDAVAAGAPVAIVQHDLAFHSRLVGLLGGRRLARFYNRLLAELLLSFLTIDRASGESRRSVSEHRRLYKLLLSGSKKAAKAALLAHLNDSEARLRAVIRDGSGTNQGKG